MNCADCAASGIEVAATRMVGRKGYCSSHARKYFPSHAQLPPVDQEISEIENEEENEMETTLKRGEVREKIAELRAAGKSQAEICRELGISSATASYHFSVLNALDGKTPPTRGPKAKPAEDSEVPEMPALSTEAKAMLKRHEKRGRTVATNPAAAESALAVAESKPPVRTPALQQAQHSNGRLSARVVMCEVEGDTAAIQSAIEAVRAVLAERS